MVKVGWKQKAAIARACARIPFGDPLYKFGQKRFGQLKSNPTSRLSKQVEMARWLTKHGAGIGGKSFFEVGTGHIPIVPLGFYLAGATQTWTVDLNRRLDWGLVGETLHWIASNKTAVTALYRDEIVAADVFEQRFTALMETSGDARACLAKAGVRYLAPIDAASTKLAAESVDCHYSVTVLEHIPVDGLRGYSSRRGASSSRMATHCTSWISATIFSTRTGRFRGSTSCGSRTKSGDTWPATDSPIAAA